MSDPRAPRVCAAALAQGTPAVKTRDRRERLGTAGTNAPLFDAARELAAKVRRRQTAPLNAILAIDAATTLPYEEGCRRERELFVESVSTEQAKALIHAFFAEVPEAASTVQRQALPITR